MCGTTWTNIAHRRGSGDEGVAASQGHITYPNLGRGGKDPAWRTFGREISTPSKERTRAVAVGAPGYPGPLGGRDIRH